MKGKITGHGEARRFYLDGKSVSQSQFEAAFPPVTSESGDGLVGWKPLASDALAVHPDLISQAIASARAKGIAVEFLPDGRPLFTSRSQRRDYLRAYHFHDNQGGYGDG